MEMQGVSNRGFSPETDAAAAVAAATATAAIVPKGSSRSAPQLQQQQQQPTGLTKMLSGTFLAKESFFFGLVRDQGKVRQDPKR